MASPIVSQQRVYAWDDAGRGNQELRLRVTGWDYKVFPHRSSPNRFGEWMFQFEGICILGPLGGVEVIGSIEVLPHGESYGMFSDMWTVVPEIVEGHAWFSESKDRSVTPNFAMTLYCQQSALDWIYRAFAVGAHSRAGGLVVMATIDCPNNQGGAFWQDRWRQERLRVVKWELYAGARIVVADGNK